MPFTDLFFPQASDSVAVFDDGFSQVFANARPIRVQPRPTSRLLKHPTENGQSIADYSVIEPILIDMQLIVEAQFYRDTYQEIKNLFQTKQYLTVQTRADTFANMVIVDMPNDENPNMLNALSINLIFEQVLVVTPTSNFLPSDPAQVDTQQLGEQSTYPVTPVASSANGVAPVVPPPPLTGMTPENAQKFYSSVQTSQLPAGYTISGLQTPSGTTSISSDTTIPAGIVNPQTLINQNSISSAFSFGAPTSIGTQ